MRAMRRGPATRSPGPPANSWPVGPKRLARRPQPQHAQRTTQPSPQIRGSLALQNSAPSTASTCAAIRAAHNARA
eukprot:10193076-Alexandrium_andersonii.AAC.1